MANRRSKAPDDEFGELFEGIGDERSAKKTLQSKAAAAAKAKADGAGQDILAELEDELQEKPSRPHTPRIREPGGARASPAKRTSTNTPPLSAGRNSEDKPSAGLARKSGESTRSYHASFTPSATSSEPHDGDKKAAAEQTAESGGGWWGWGSILASAGAAVEQAGAAVKEIRQNEEAMRWANQVRGNVDSLKGFGDELRHRALPTFTNILHTIAPPISSHERLLIHTTHDLVGYPPLDPLIYEVFDRVMAQVEGGDLLVVQRGQESTLRSPTSDKPPAASLFAGNRSAATARWNDGSWWRQVDAPRDLGLVKGLTEGTKLCRASAEAYAHDYFAAHGGVEEARRRSTEHASESNPVRTSDLFLAVQAVAVEADGALFVGSAAEEREREDSAVLEAGDGPDDQVCFAVFVLDPVHEIQYAAVSQALPAQWIRWLDAGVAPLTPASGDDENTETQQQQQQHVSERVPEEIREIVESGGVDPREWVAEWVEELLKLSVGVVAQRYVARRMGVGEGGIGKGKRKVEAVVQDGAGEAARAGI